MLSPKDEEPHHRHPSSKHIEIKPGAEDNHTQVVKDFLRDRGVGFILAFSGGADDNVPVLDAFREMLGSDPRIPSEVQDDLKKIAGAAVEANASTLIRDVLTGLKGYRIAVQTGGTKWGVPKVAAKVAKELGFPTIGVYPLTAKMKGYALPDELLDLSVCVHPFYGESAWGDESFVFTKMMDSVVVIGGNAGTMVEVAHLLKINEKDSLTPKKWIVPVYGTGGTADKVSTFPGKPHTMASCIPSRQMTKADEVLNFLRETVLTEDIYEPA